jgi:hypothetical protein
MTIEKVEHVAIEDRKYIRIVWRHPLAALAMIGGSKSDKVGWDQFTNDWMPADLAKDLAAGITKALRQKPIKGPKRKTA